MESLIFDLYQVLERQRVILKEMLAASREHNQALRQNNIIAVKESTGRVEELAGRLKIHNRQRELSQKALGTELDVTEEIVLGKLLPFLPEKHGARLSGLADEIKSIAMEIAGLAELNGVLTRNALHFNEQLLGLLTPVHNSTYQPGGNSAVPAGSASLLINKTV